MKIKNAAIIAVILFLYTSVFAHPTGNIITVGEHVLWSYINPIDNPNHYACVMIWERGSEPKVLIQSEFAASDYMLYNNLNEIYIVERKYLQSSNSFEIRVLKLKVDEKPNVIWDWFKDEYRIGESGFVMLSDYQMVFGKYPHIFSLTKGEKPQKYFEFSHPIKKIRGIENKQILLLSENSCYLVEQNGTILKQWNNLIENNVENTPLNLNVIFDADYSSGELLLAYWGNRSFDLINPTGERKTILKQSEPLTPHWTAFWNKEKLLFSSKLIFDGSTPKPHLILINAENEQEIIWSSQ